MYQTIPRKKTTNQIEISFIYSVERYNPDTNTWTKISDMNSRRSGAGVGVVDNKLYAGKNSNWNLIKISNIQFLVNKILIECFDLCCRFQLVDTMVHWWKKVARNTVLRLIHGVPLVVSDQVIAIDRLETFTFNNHLHYLIDMSYRRRNAGVVCHDGLLFGEYKLIFICYIFLNFKFESKFWF